MDLLWRKSTPPLLPSEEEKYPIVELQSMATALLLDRGMAKAASRATRPSPARYQASGDLAMPCGKRSAGWMFPTYRTSMTASTCSIFPSLPS